MSDAKYTPGPWSIREDSASWEIEARIPWLDKLTTIEHISVRPTLHIGDGGQVIIRQLAYESWNQFPSHDWREMQAANARLIAAAPELFEALRYLRHCASRDLHDGCGVPGACPLCRAYAALAGVRS